MKLLIAEDDATSRRMLEAILTKWGHEVICTSDGAEAYQALIEEDAPHLAILDCMMPVMSGLDICKKISKLELAAPPYIILLTSLSKKENIIEGLNAGADEYITKPFNTGELRARIGAGQRIIELRTDLQERNAELEEAASHIETLQGIIPICAGCHKIRNDEESWQKIECYIEKNSKAKFSHSLCPECLKTYYPEENF